MNRKKVDTALIITSYLLGFLVSIASALYILAHSGGHGGGSATWYNQFLIPGIYVAAIFPPHTILLAVLLYTLVIGSILYLPVKLIFKF